VCGTPFTEIENAEIEKIREGNLGELNLELCFGYEFEMSVRYPVQVQMSGGYGYVREEV
jgi:hypothetical protein